MFPLKLYAVLGLLLTLSGSIFYTQHLRTKVAAQQERIASLEETERNLREAQKALEEVYAKRRVTGAKTNTIKREVDHSEDVPLPAPIERALDGLRGLQAERKPRSS